MSRYDWCAVSLLLRLWLVGAIPITGSTSSVPPCLQRRPPWIRPCRWHTSRLSRRARSSIRCCPSIARCIPFPRAPDRTRTRTCSSAPCRNVWCCAAPIAMRTTVRTTRIRFTPRTTTSTSSPCTWTGDRCLSNFPTEFR